jgi:hypothetical protein
MAIGMIIGSVFWLTERIDRLERENGTKIVQLMVTQKVNKLAASVADYAYWDKGYATWFRSTTLKSTLKSAARLQQTGYSAML